MMSNTG